MSIYLVYFLIGINVLAFYIMGYDKLKAKQKKRRIPERQLFWYAIIGGSIGTFVAMKVYRHKTQHPSFQYGIPAIILLHIAAAVYFLWFY
ncbi:DUF1294 domain-containing protein [Paenibacillus psychroresistens]|uniref:DUF1294 domain-containing protein n=1 Tax=Paenibacillus psychroresistens TaxID=1778678 RepID=A0A6B8RRD6_9BACL|nr:DUF1294 domain-containing protein [Paenibacillus psychroresistens]QGQ98272.1 DUF1294 domain-containing protein [Paenibacillus psychroresistens]